MAPRRPYYTSNTLIDAVKRKISMPLTQVTFSDEDILAFADEEMMLEQIPSILQYHEEYLVFTHTEQLVPNKSKYQIPGRAIGMKLRDVFFRDPSGQLIEMSKVNPDDRTAFERSGSIPTFYYIQNNSVILLPEISGNPSGGLEFTYYLRPNSLVPDNKAAICKSFSKSITINNVALLPGDTIKIGSTIITAGTDFAIGANNSITALNLSVYINSVSSVDGVTANANSSVVSLVFSNRSLSISTSNPVALVVQKRITINAEIPANIVAGSVVDILQMESGHSTLAIDVQLASSSVSSSGITLTEEDLPQEFIVGDYICSSYECIVPQIPTDLHNLLAERTCARILEALGDMAGLQTANSKIDSLEKKQTIIMDNRVEGSPSKVLNRTGLLRRGRSNSGRRG